MVRALSSGLSQHARQGRVSLAVTPSRRSALAGLCLAACLAALSGCAALRAPGEQAGCASKTASVAVLDRLYLGHSKPGGGEVTESEFKSFLHEAVTPRFPQGLTVVHASGQWRMADGRISSERTTILELAHDASTADRVRIGEIVAEYKRRFRQESVLWLSHAVCAAF
jgi:hypothetical protein